MATEPETNPPAVGATIGTENHGLQAGDLGRSGTISGTRCDLEIVLTGVRSGMLVMPQMSLPNSIRETAEIGERGDEEEVVCLYGIAYHLWQVDKGHRLPLGEPQLMTSTSLTAPGQLHLEKRVGGRDRRFTSDYKGKAEARRQIASASPSVRASNPGDVRGKVVYDGHDGVAVRRDSGTGNLRGCDIASHAAGGLPVLNPRSLARGTRSQAGRTGVRALRGRGSRLLVGEVGAYGVRIRWYGCGGQRKTTSW